MYIDKVVFQLSYFLGNNPLVASVCGYSGEVVDGILNVYGGGLSGCFAAALNGIMKSIA